MSPATEGGHVAEETGTNVANASEGPESVYRGTKITNRSKCPTVLVPAFMTSHVMPSSGVVYVEEWMPCAHNRPDHTMFKVPEDPKM